MTEKHKKIFQKGENNAYADKLFKEYAKYPRCPKISEGKKDLSKVKCPKHSMCPKVQKYPNNPNDPLCEDIKDIKRGIRNEIVEQYQDFVKSLTNRYMYSEDDFDDVQQIAFIGLMSAVESYQIKSGNTFMTYATPFIIGYIRNYYRDYGQIMRVPREIYELAGKIENANKKLEQEYFRNPTEQELADYLKVDLALVRETLIATSVHYNPESLENIHNKSEGTGGTLMDTLVSDDSFWENFIIQESINKYTKDFTDEEYDTFVRIVLYNESQKSVADELKVNQTTVGRRAKKLKKRFIEKLIDDYTYDFTDEEYFIFKDLYVENKSVNKVAKEMNIKEKEVEKIGNRLKEDFLIKFLN